MENIDPFVQLFGSLVLGWLAWEIRQLRRDVAKRVHYEECNRRMGEHYDRLDRLCSDVASQSERIARLEENI